VLKDFMYFRTLHKQKWLEFACGQEHSSWNFYCECRGVEACERA